MKKQKYTWVNSLKEVLIELLLPIILFLGVSIVALLIGVLLPKDFLAGLPFEFLIFLAVLLGLFVLYVIAAIVRVVQKEKAKAKESKSDDT